ncbi:hypothetical protein COBT_001698, partial [Conglomerata obtusa]
MFAILNFILLIIFENKIFATTSNPITYFKKLSKHNDKSIPAKILTLRAKTRSQDDREQTCECQCVRGGFRIKRKQKTNVDVNE